MDLQMTGRHILKAIERQSPSILTGLGVTGFITTVVLAVKATPRAQHILDDEVYFRHTTNEPAPKGFDIVKLTWKCYIPATTVGVMSVACFIGSNSINLRRNAILAGLYTISERAMEEYQEKVIELFGKGKEEKVRDSMSQDKLNEDPISGKAVFLTGKGETLFYDSWSGRYFKSDMETIRKTQNDLNHDMLGGEMYSPLNDLYDALGLEGVEAGNHIGWDVDNLLDIHFSAKISTDGQPCIVLEYKPKPKEY